MAGKVFFYKDKKNRLIRVNEAFARETGMSKEETEGKSVFELIPDSKLASAYWRDDKEVMRTGVAKKNIIEPLITDEERWFQTDKIPYKDENGKITGIIGFSLDITDKRLVAEALKRREEELKIKNKSLEELNTALKVLLKKCDEDRLELEEKVLINVKQLTGPYLTKLLKSGLTETQEAYAKIIESHLKDVISPFMYRLNSKHLSLTPQELNVADLTKQGKRTKEIAKLLGLSANTVQAYRKSLRRKLGIKNKKVNLRTHLMSHP